MVDQGPGNWVVLGGGAVVLVAGVGGAVAVARRARRTDPAGSADDVDRDPDGADQQVERGEELVDVGPVADGDRDGVSTDGDAPGARPVPGDAEPAPGGDEVEQGDPSVADGAQDPDPPGAGSAGDADVGPVHTGATAVGGPAGPVGAVPRDGADRFPAGVTADRRREPSRGRPAGDRRAPGAVAPPARAPVGPRPARPAAALPRNKRKKQR